MIATLRGKVLATTDSGLIIDVGGIGFAVNTVPAVKTGSDIGIEIFLHTALIVREDSFTLFGYQSAPERDFFQLLQTVSGIGPKVSHAILSTLSIGDIVRAITAGESKPLEQVSGLGKKGGQRIILELKEKVSSFSSVSSKDVPIKNSDGLSLAQALTGLGFNPREIDYALEVVESSAAKTMEQRLKVALAALQGGGSRV